MKDITGISKPQLPVRRGPSVPGWRKNTARRAARAPGEVRNCFGRHLLVYWFNVWRYLADKMLFMQPLLPKPPWCFSCFITLQMCFVDRIWGHTLVRHLVCWREMCPVPRGVEWTHGCGPCQMRSENLKSRHFTSKAEPAPLGWCVLDKIYLPGSKFSY